MKTCEHCDKPGKLGTVVPYWIDGKNVWLHTTKCSKEWHQAWREKQK